MIAVLAIRVEGNSLIHISTFNPLFILCDHRFLAIALCLDASRLIKQSYDCEIEEDGKSLDLNFTFEMRLK